MVEGLVGEWVTTETETSLGTPRVSTGEVVPRGRRLSERRTLTGRGWGLSWKTGPVIWGFRSEETLDGLLRFSLEPEGQRFYLRLGTREHLCVCVVFSVTRGFCGGQPPCVCKRIGFCRLGRRRLVAVGGNEWGVEGSGLTVPDGGGGVLVGMSRDSGEDGGRAGTGPGTLPTRRSTWGNWTWEGGDGRRFGQVTNN